MQIFAEEGIANTLGTMFSSLSNENFYVVQLEPALPGHNRQDIRGLDAALEVADKGLPVVMLGWLTPAMYIDKRPQEWFAATGYANVIFLRLPATSEEVLGAIKEVQSGNRRSDPLAIALLGVAQTNTTVAVLHHDLSSAERDAERMVSWEKKAREVFGDKNQAELISLVTDVARARHTSSKLAGQKFPDVCVDIEGTLLDSDGNIRWSVIDIVEEKVAGGAVTIWTGGDIHELSKKLRTASIFYKITSKESMRGATVRVVIDDQPEATFKSERGVEYDEYIQV